MNFRNRVLKSIQISVVSAVQRDDPEVLSNLLHTRLASYGLDELALALRVAAEKGHEECARILLEEGHVMPSLHDSSGYTPLILAAKTGQTDLVRLLIEAGSNVNKATYRIRSTALHWAATNGHYRNVALLLKNGANPDARTVHGRTALMLASRSDQPDIVMDLIMAKVDVNAGDYQCATALHLAAEEGAEDSVKELLRCGANVNAQTLTGDTPIMRAAARGHSNVVAILLRGRIQCDLQKRGRQLTALHWAAMGGSVTCVQLLLDADMDVNVYTTDSYSGGDYFFSRGLSPLMLACREGHAQCVATLLENHAVLSQKDDDNMTALCYAVRADNPACVLLLIRSGADPDGEFIQSEDNDKMPPRRVSPLFAAIKKNSKSCLKILLRANCDVTTMGYQGDQIVGPLEYALHRGHIDAARMLIARGIDLKFSNGRVLEEALTQLYLKSEEIAGIVVNELRTFPSLQHVARQTIRRQMGIRAHDDVNLLPLPSALKRYVDIDVLDDFT